MTPPSPPLSPPLLAVLILCLVALSRATSHLSSGPHIADVNILLPPKMTHPVEYRLQGSDSCFKWSWDHHDILSVLPEYNVSNHCSASARLRSIAPFSGPKETAVYAADVYTGIVIRVKVFIDNISRIQIFHNSIKLDLDGLTTLRVRAFDSEDNVFSSLVGLRFMWQLTPETNGLPHHLVHVPLKDSPLSDCGGLCGDLNIQIKFEDSGVFSDLLVVKGTRIGHENVSVHLHEPQFKHMADQIVLTVAEAMSLEPPSPVFVLIGAVLHYSLKVMRASVSQVVTLPSPHHKWSASNLSVAEVDSKQGVAHAQNLGVTAVIVEDTRVAGHIQVSSLNVVLPDSLCLYILLLSTHGDPVEGIKAIPSMAHWYVVSGRQYLIQMKVIAQGLDAHEIYITESDDLKLHDEQSEHWTTFMPSDDIVAKHSGRNSRLLAATSPGLGKLTASLTYFSGHHETKEVLKVGQEVIVCDHVKFNLDGINGTSQTILLPWAPSVYQEVELKATGGCARASSDYKWFSSDMATLLVSASGVVQARKPGKATVKVVSAFDSFNYDEVVIEVSSPSSMKMLQNFPVETVVGSYLQASVTMKAPNGAFFFACDAFHLFVRWKSGSESFVIVNAAEEPLALEKLGTELHVPYGPPCSWTYVYALASGRSTLHATLSKEDGELDQSFRGPNVLKAAACVAAYPPLTVLQLGDGNQYGGYWCDLALVEISSHSEKLEKLYLAPGSSLDVVLFGGPEPWDKGVDFIETVEIFDDKHLHVKDAVHVYQVSGRYQSYRVVCQTLGGFNLVFKRGNLVGVDHPLPAIEEAVLSLLCSFPSSISLIVDEPVNKLDVIRTATVADRGTGQIRVSPVTVANGQTIRVAVVGIDITGEAFGNSSSLSLKWESIGCEGLAYWDNTYESKESKSSWERFLVLQNESGQCIVRATVTGFGGIMGSQYSAELQISEQVLTDAILLQIVSTLRINPEFNLLYLNPNAKANLSITGGSCFWEANVNDTEVLEVIQPPPRLQCSQLMLSPKALGAALVTVYDIGLTPSVAATAVVQVADVDWIKIVSGEEITLMEGQSQSIDILAGIHDGSIFDSHQYAYMNIHVSIEDCVVELVHNDGIYSPSSRIVNAPNFMIVAKHLGITNLYVSMGQQSGHEIRSQTIKVEVYAPLSIHPCDTFLVPGTSYLLTTKGGPTIGVYIEYASMDDTIATVAKSTGKLSAISPGNTTILSTVYRNGDIAVCQAYCSVKVGVPSLAVLNAQSEQLDIGREMPIYPSFPEGDLFSFYEVCNRYKWSVDDEKVLSFYRPESLHDENLWFFVDDDERELGFANVLLGRSAGRTNIAVTFSCDFVSTSYSQSRVYNASLSILVVPNLPLALGAPITWLLPPNYITSGLLPSSVESHGQLDSSSRRGTIIYSVLRSCSEKNEALQKDVISIEGDRIRTMESNNIACIQAKDRNSGGVEIASCVRVAEVAQIRMVAKGFPFHVIHLAVGTELDIPISYFDTLGNPFYEADSIVPYDVETNYRDIISIVDSRNGSDNIHLKALHHGRALVRVSLDYPLRTDYLLISVGAHISPQNPVLRQGSSLNFRVEGIDDLLSGHWHSANKSILSVDTISGKAEAVGVGSTQVFFECPNMKMETEVAVLSGNTVFIDAPKEMLTNAPYPTKGYSFSVKFSDRDKFETIGKEVSFDCKVDPPFVGYAKPWMDLNTGSSCCLFFPFSPEHLVYSLPGSKGMKPYVSVSVIASLRGSNNVSGSASALFIGGFSIMGMEKGLLQLNLTPHSNNTIITILGNTDVEIHWNERNLMKISPISKEDYGVGGSLQYEVKVLENKRFKDKIVFALPANGQRVEMDVNCEPGAGVESKVISNEAFWTIVAALLALVILAVTFLTISSRASNRLQPPVSAATPNVTEPITPERGSPPITTDHSPRTPQPFVDYVRRTIDETPYYRREARRRVNPQNTY